MKKTAELLKLQEVERKEYREQVQKESEETCSRQRKDYED